MPHVSRSHRPSTPIDAALIRSERSHGPSELH